MPGNPAGEPGLRVQVPISRWEHVPLLGIGRLLTRLQKGRDEVFITNMIRYGALSKIVEWAPDN